MKLRVELEVEDVEDKNEAQAIIMGVEDDGYVVKSAWLDGEKIW